VVIKPIQEVDIPDDAVFIPARKGRKAHFISTKKKEGQPG